MIRWKSRGGLGTVRPDELPPKTQPANSRHLHADILLQILQVLRTAKPLGRKDGRKQAQVRPAGEAPAWERMRCSRNSPGKCPGKSRNVHSRIRCHSVPTELKPSLCWWQFSLWGAIDPKCWTLSPPWMYVPGNWLLWTQKKTARKEERAFQNLPPVGTSPAKAKQFPQCVRQSPSNGHLTNWDTRSIATI